MTYQALRIAITDATIARPGIDLDCSSLSVALNALVTSSSSLPR